jgi:hypothetical protein
MARASFTDLRDPLRDGAEAIAQYIERKSVPGIDSFHCEENSKGLFVLFSGETERRFRLAELDASNQNDNRQSANGHERALTLEQLLQMNLAPPPAVNILFNTTIATAIVDRLVENSEILLLGGDSLRKAKNPSTSPAE